MRNVLIVVNDETLINRMKIAFNNKDYSYFYATEGSSAIAIADNNEIAVAIIDFRLPILSGVEICETLSSINISMQFIFLFAAEDIEDVLKFYNKYHINKLICKEELELGDLHDNVDDCMHKYYQREELVKMKEKVDAVSEKYLKPMTDMSNLLNERLKCYDYIKKVFQSCMASQTDKDYEGFQPLKVFIDRIVEDFIQLFMIVEPDADEFLNNLSHFYNRPESKKYFKFENNEVNIDESNKLNILFALNVISICFDTFFPMYRGKIVLSKTDSEISINSVYEIRYDDTSKDVADRALQICKEVLDEYCDKLKYARKESLVQYKATIIKQGIE